MPSPPLPPSRLIGYARVSTYGQTLDAQLDQLRAEGCAKLYREKASGAQPERRELQRMLKRLTFGDVVMVTRIDRLARSTFDLFAITKRIVDAAWTRVGSSVRSPSPGPTPRPAPGG